MRKIESLLDEYGASHINRTNKIIHWICVPPIVWTVVALLWTMPFPAALQSDIVPVNWATLALLLAQIYYFRLSWQLGLGLLFYGIFLPIGLIFKLIGRDPMHRKFDKNMPSYRNSDEPNSLYPNL